MLSFLYLVIVKPIEFIIDIVFVLTYRVLRNPGFAIIAVSVVINFLILPLYQKADHVQEKVRKREEKLHPWIKHIKKNFKGDERFMMLSAFYKTQNYSPFYVVGGSMSLLLEIPFFIAAYHYLSNLEVLNDTSFFIIKNLGTEDRLLNFSIYAINLLPILMTLINFVSSAIYTKGFLLKDKIQLYILNILFLFLLYHSPSGLVLYWTINNIFSLGKNLFTKVFPNPRKIAYLCCSLTGILVFVFLYLNNAINSPRRKILLVLFTIILQIPFIIYLIRKNNHFHFSIPGFPRLKSVSNGVFLSGALFLTILSGLLIPSAVISSSPVEFIDIGNYSSPLYIIAGTVAISGGYFLFWFNIIYIIINKQGKNLLSLLLWMFSGISILDYMLFYGDFGILSPLMKFNFEPQIPFFNIILNVVAIFLFCIVLVYIWNRSIKLVKLLYLLLSLSVVGMTFMNCISIQKELEGMTYLQDEVSAMNEGSEIGKIIPLSKKGKNVIVFMLDRAISAYFPFLLEEKQVLKRQFAGFTYYPNTIAYGSHTIYSSPALFGGYEYTPEEINKRDTELLSKKHNDALKIMPAIFSENGYNITVCDPPLAGYKSIGDLSIYDAYPNVHSYHTMGRYTKNFISNTHFNSKEYQYRLLFSYSLFRMAPVVFQSRIYDMGRYLSMYSDSYTEIKPFIDQYSVLVNLRNFTKIDSTPYNSFFMIDNETTHEPCLLQEPDYIPSLGVNNTSYETGTRVDSKGYSITLETTNQLTHYQANMAALLQLGKWFDFLRENDLYDNTRIIIVSDHGWSLNQFPSMQIDEVLNVEKYNALLLFKDFNERDLNTADDFMTIADVPLMAFKDLIENPINPFTEKKIDNAGKKAQGQLITTADNFNIAFNNGNVFDTSGGYFYRVHDNIFDPNCWERVE